MSQVKLIILLGWTNIVITLVLLAVVIWQQHRLNEAVLSANDVHVVMAEAVTKVDDAYGSMVTATSEILRWQVRLIAMSDCAAAGSQEEIALCIEEARNP